MTVLERAAQEVADATAQRSGKPASPLRATTAEPAGLPPLLNALRETHAVRAATAQTVESLRNAFGTQR